ncbi:MAG: hypothetical protein IT426_14920 [Pirellulales bacterium]|nr:hypothetical protein [Pirellulales bacterium]
MTTISEKITAELSVLLGQPIGDCWRAANMQIFEFGSRHRKLNRMGEEIEVSDFRLHVQCRWRMTDAKSIIFGRDDLNYPADDSILLEEFDWDKQPSVLDMRQKQWFEEHRAQPLKVVYAHGDVYGGFRIALEGDFALEAFSCDSRKDEYSEHWRLLGHRTDGAHFVVTGHGIEGKDRELTDDH